MPGPSQRGALPPFIAMDMVREANRLAADGASILHLELGQPGAGAPASVLEKAASLLRSTPLGYTDALGIPPLRRRIARHYVERYGAKIDPARIAVTVGASGAFLLAFLACFDAGDRVAVGVPGYPSYRHILSALGIETVLIETDAANGFQPTPAELDAIMPPLNGLVVASPANPAGSVLSPGNMSNIAAWCCERGVRLISDEIYHGITYEARAASALESLSEAVVVNSFSKYFGMTGWRLGWVVVPADLARSVECIGQNFVISPPTLAQHTAIHAFDAAAELDARVVQYRRNRDQVLALLPATGLRALAEPQGAFFVYAEIESGEDSLVFCRRALAETGVAMTPGLDFDPLRGGHTLRISYSGEEDQIIEALQRLARWRH